MDRSNEATRAITSDVLIVEDLCAERPLPESPDPAKLVELCEASSSLAELRRFGLRFERVRLLELERLLLFTAPGSALRLNGLPAPLVRPLALGDQLSKDAGTLLHVSRRQQSEAIPTPAWLVGRSCPLCQVEFEPTTLVLQCGACGTARHLEGAERPEDERLSCADLGPCPNCNKERPREGGLAYYPER